MKVNMKIKKYLLSITLIFGSYGYGYSVCGFDNWSGIVFASPSPSSGLHPNTIEVTWDLYSYNSTYTIQFQDITTDGDWQIAETDYKKWYYYISVNPKHNYNVAVIATCPDGSTKIDIRYQVAGESFSELNNCFGLWSGLTTYSVDYNSLKVRWTDAGVDHYEVWLKRDDPHADPPTEWEKKGDDIHGFEYTVNDLIVKSYYWVIIVAVCRDGTRLERKAQFSIYIDGITTAYCPAPANLYQIPASTSVTVSATMYTYLINETLKYYITYAELNSSNYITIPWQFAGLNRENGPGDFKTITGLKPGTFYMWYITMVCNQTGSNTGTSYSPMSIFQTKGPCESTYGDYELRKINNSSGKAFYSGIILADSAVSLSSAKYSVVSQEIDLNPGFNTYVSSTGVFVIEPFDPATCAMASSGRVEMQDQNVSPSDTLNEVSIAKNQNQAINEAIRIYPNPTTGIVRLQIGATDELKMITISDVSGKLVYTHDARSNELDVSTLPSGVYFLKVQTFTTVQILKLFKL